MSAVDLLFDALSDYRADRSMQRKPVAGADVVYHVAGGEHRFTIRVEGKVVATATGASIDVAARRCTLEFRTWHDDQPAYLEHALAVSLKLVRAAR